MKKYYLSLAAVAALSVIFTSCNNEDFINDSDYCMDTEIKVNAMVNTYGTTRAVSNLKTTSEELTSFSMWGFNTSTSSAQVTSTGSALGTSTGSALGTSTGSAQVTAIMNGDTYTKGVDSKYTAANLYYWPADASKIKFYALAENNVAVKSLAKASSTKITAADGITVTDYEVAVDGAMDDPVYAFSSGKTSKTDVTLVFNHFLSRVGVAVAYNSEKSKGNLQIRVLGYEFRNVCLKGSANVNSNGKLTWEPSKSGWVKDAAVAEESWGTSKTLSEGIAPVSYSDTFLSKNESLYRDGSWSNVIPGDKADQLVIVCALFDENGAYIATRYLTKALTATGSYDAGKQYIYNVYITNNAGKDTDGNDDDKDGHDDEPVNDLSIDIVEFSVAPWSTAVGGEAEFKN